MEKEKETTVEELDATQKENSQPQPTITSIVEEKPIEKEETKKEKKNLWDISSTIIIVILIIIIILLCFRSCSNKNKTQKTPTGNIDIFEIVCETNCPMPQDKPDDEVKPTSTPIQRPTNTQTPTLPTEPAPEEDNVQVLDKNIIWTTTNELKIFENPMYDYDEVIAPGSTNIYQFVVKNSTEYEIQYEIEFKEVNKDHINMKYRLKKNKDYIAGDNDTWVTYESLTHAGNIINAKSSDTYYLEWKWFDSANDNEIAEKGDVTYELQIDLKAKQAIE